MIYISATVQVLANHTYFKQVQIVFRVGSTKSQQPSSLQDLSIQVPLERHCCHVCSARIWAAVWSFDILLIFSTETVCAPGCGTLLFIWIGGDGGGVTTVMGMDSFGLMQFDLGKLKWKNPMNINKGFWKKNKTCSYLVYKIFYLSLVLATWQQPKELNIGFV